VRSNVKQPLGPVEKVSQSLNEMTRVSRIGTTVRFRDVFLRGSFYGSASGMRALESVREGMLKNIYAAARPAVTGDFPCL